MTSQAPPMQGATMDIEQVLQFWFGERINSATPSAQANLWWRKQPEVDQQIREDFADGLRDLAEGKYRDWLHSARGRLAAIIVLDQFSRNMYRDRPEAFAQDQLALAWCLEGLEDNIDLQLEPIERVFFYLPLEHSEDLQMQVLSCRKFAELLKCSSSTQTAQARGTYEDFSLYAERHREVIQQFGRFPHRNKILGRASTAVEQQYLDTPGSGF
ncbi:DUF924 domain-containing protein [Porticoccaceae bacterium]|nr:DUF924 domain-containing protein [Porticoccaceae bacterium]